MEVTEHGQREAEEQAVRAAVMSAPKVVRMCAVMQGVGGEAEPAGRQCLEAEQEFYALSHSGNCKLSTGAPRISRGCGERRIERKAGARSGKAFYVLPRGLAFPLAGAPGRCSAGEPRVRSLRQPREEEQVLEETCTADCLGKKGLAGESVLHLN